MIRKFLLGILCLFLVFILVGNPWTDDKFRYAVMRPDTQTMIEWMIDFETAPRAFIDPVINNRLNFAKIFLQGTSMNLLGHLDYIPDDRHQGWCGNCWAWAGTGIMEVAHDVQNGVFDRLSLQFLDSCRADFACCGGGLGGFATWYSGVGYAIPWSNTNAAFADINRKCEDGASLVACGGISTDPYYPLISIAEVTIPTYKNPDAVTNIKNVLNQNKAIYFWFALPNHEAWEDFGAFWDGVHGETEESLWAGVDAYCGVEWNEAAGECGAHAVLLLGYNDDDLDPNNHYWLVLNSWGTGPPPGLVRPNGLFRIPMNVMNYDCEYPDTESGKIFQAFGFQTLNVEFDNAAPVADTGGPYGVECDGSATSVMLDGTGSYDPEDGPLSYSWATDCPSASFNDPTSPTPILTVDTLNGCSINCNVTLTITDDVNAIDTAISTVTISDTIPPEIICPLDITVECTENCGIQSSDFQLDPFFAGVSATDGCDPIPVIVDNAPSFFNIGITVVTFTATDYCSNSSSCTATVTVVDTIPPEMEVTLNRYELWPPNHKLVEIDATVTVTDVCDPDASFVLTSITSNEPDDGLGDGDAENDIQGADFGTADTNFKLRAERSGNGEGRIYTIVYTAFDACNTNPNNTTTVTVYVYVPKSRRK